MIMRTRSFPLLATVAAAALALPAVAASAEDPGSTTVSFEVEGSTSTNLSIAIADSSATLAVADGVASGELPATTVTDTRSSLLDVGNTWNVQVSTDDHFWRTGDDVDTFAVLRNRAHVYLPAENTVDSLLGGLDLEVSETSEGTNRLGPDEETQTEDLPGHSYTLIAGTSTLNLSGQSEHRYTPQMVVDVPGGQAEGTYEGTVMQTVSEGL